MDQEQQAEQSNSKRENFGLLRIDTLLMAFLLIGWSLIFVAATIGLSRQDQLWLPINPVVNASAANYSVDTNNSKIVQVKPEIIDAIKDDERVRDLFKPPTPTLLTELTISPTATLTETAVDLLTVSIGGPYRGFEGSPLTFMASNFDSALNFLPGSVSYRWDLDQDGLYDDAEGEMVKYTFFDEGDYAISVKAEDWLGREATAIGFAYVENADPVADVGENLYVSEGKSLGFAAVADDPGNDILSFEWDFGDETPFVLNTLNPQHTYADDGEYEVTLYARDNDGGQGQDSLIVFVGNLPPEVDAGPDREVDEGSELALAGTAEDPAGDFDTLSYAWDFNYRGVFQPDLEGEQVTTVYPDGPDQVTVALQVKDEDGGEEVDTLDVTVRNVPPTITRLTNDGPSTEGSPLNLTVAATDPGQDTLTYAFDWNGDGSFDSETDTGEVAYTYPNQGTFTVTVRVRDDDGGEDFASTSATVLNVAPTVVADCSSDSVFEGISITCTGQDSFDPGSNDSLTYRWDFGDGTVVDGMDASHTYADNGVYSTTLTVTDDSGESSVDALFTTVLNANPTIDVLELEFDSIPEFRPGSDDNVSLDQLIKAFEASDPGPEDNQNLIYQWDVVYNGTSTLLSGKNPAFTLEDIDGPSEIRLTARVRDKDYPASTANGGQIGEATRLLVVNVDNVPPRDLRFAGPRYVRLDGETRGYVGLANETIQLSATANDVTSDEDQLTYDWDLNNDGTFEILDAQTTQFNQSNTGAYDIRVRVSDGDDEATRSTRVYVIQPADAGTYPDTPPENTPVTFDAGSSGNPGQALLTYVWNFGDGSSPNSGRTVSHRYADNGAYTVKLCLFLATQATKTCNIASDNSFSADTSPITISNANPQVTIAGPSSGSEGATLTFTSIATDTSADTLTYSWNFGDSSPVISGTNQATVSRFYRDEGSYTLTLTVTDEDGGRTPVTRTVSITNLRPLVKATDGLKATEGQVITVTGVATDVIDDALTYTWDLDNDGLFDDTTPTQATTAGTSGAFKTVNLPAAASWSSGGLKTIAVQVIDGDGGVATDTTTVDVNFIPRAEAGGPYSGNEGEAITFTGAATDPNSGDTLRYTWNMGDGSNLIEGRVISYPYKDNGAYTATLIVDDGHGGVNSDTAQVTINNLPPVITALTGPTTGDEGQPLNLTAAASDTVSDTLTYRWDFDNNGVVDQAGPNLTAVTHAYPDEGNYTLRLTVADDDGASVTDTLAIAIRNAPPTAAMNGPFSGDEGTTNIAFNAGASRDPGLNDTLSYVWNLGDGSPTASGVTVNHIYAADGIYTVTLTVTDDSTPPASDTEQARVTIRNVLPTARITGGPFTVAETDPTVDFNASTSSDPGADDQTLTYLWNFGHGSPSTAANPSHTYPADDGAYTVRLTVTDSDAATHTATVQVTVNNLPPNAAIMASPQTTNENNRSISFNAGGSSDPSPTGSLTEYRWDFDDGTTATSATPVISHTYGDSGIFDASVVVVDDDGATSTAATTRVTINNLPPTAAITANPQTTNENNPTISFNAGGSTDTVDPIVQYRWNFGDGQTVTTSGAQTSHRFNDSGTYSVSVVVVDDDGATSNPATVPVTINNVGPQNASLTANPQTAGEGATITFNATVVAPAIDTLTYAWNFGDGDTTTTSGSQVTHQYGNNGVYQVIVTVTDDDNATVSSTPVQVTINNLPPTASFSANPQNTDENNLTIDFDAGASADPGNDPLTYSWDFGDGSPTVSGAQAQVSHDYTDSGSYTVNLTVTDDNGASDSASLTVDIQNLPPSGVSITGPASMPVGGTETYSGSGSDIAGDPLTFEWFVDGNSQGTGTSFDFSPAVSGTYTIELQVTDDEGSSASNSISVTVNSFIPLGWIGLPFIWQRLRRRWQSGKPNR